MKQKRKSSLSKISLELPGLLELDPHCSCINCKELQFETEQKKLMESNPYNHCFPI